MKYILALLSVAIMFSITACDEAGEQTSTTANSNYQYTAVVQKAIQTSKYTYCLVKEETFEYWIAISKMDIKNGQTIFYNQGHEMKNFHSKELDRTFRSVFFIQEASTDPNSETAMSKKMSMKPKTAEAIKTDIELEKAEGGITIAELYADKASYEGKKVRIRGKVTKFNAAIMGKNWIHIQDGTDHNGEFDLTVTTEQKVNKGATIILEGTITLDKDFGAGYKYDVIMEEAKIVTIMVH